MELTGLLGNVLCWPVQPIYHLNVLDQTLSLLYTLVSNPLQTTDLTLPVPGAQLQNAEAIHQQSASVPECRLNLRNVQQPVEPNLSYSPRVVVTVIVEET